MTRKTMLSMLLVGAGVLLSAIGGMAEEQESLSMHLRTLAKKNPPSQSEVEDFKNKHLLKNEKNLDIQEITGDSFPTTQGQVSLEDMTPAKLFAEGGKYVVDGVEQDTLPAFVYESQLEDTIISASVDPDGSIMSAFELEKSTGKFKSLQKIKKGFFAKIGGSDFDEDKLKKYKADHAVAPPDRKMLRKLNHEAIGFEFFDAELDATTTRRLAACASFKVIEMAISYDKTYCDSHQGDESAATAAITAIFGIVKIMYAQADLCVDLQLTYLGAHCASDPFPISSTRSVCDGPKNLLDKFDMYANSVAKSEIPRDIWQLVVKRGYPGNVIGCAWLGTVCNRHWEHGVNDFYWTTSQILHSVLVAHETGHVVGAGHDSTNGGNIMSSYICTCSAFSTQSATQINTKLSNLPACIPTTTYSCTIATDCDDGNPCTTNVCENGSCNNGDIAGCCNSATDCDDGNPCTADVCGDNNSCNYEDIVDCCNDDNDCSDGYACTDDVCSPCFYGPDFRCNKVNCCDGCCGQNRCCPAR